MTEELMNAVSIAKHYTGVAVRADERGETNLKLCAQARDAARAAAKMARAAAPKETEADINEDWNGFWAEVTTPSAYDTIIEEMYALDEAACKIIRRVRVEKDHARYEAQFGRKHPHA